MSEHRILVVDDEAAIRTLLRCAVSAPGFSVFEADCGKTALLLASQQGPFEMVVSDVLMPGMDGIELATKLAAAGYAQRFLFISGYDEDGTTERIGAFPVSGFLAKPFSIPQLLSTVRDLLEQPVAARTASLRERRVSSALRHPPAPIDAVGALRRKTRRLLERRDALLEDTRWAMRTQALLLRQIESQFAAIQAIHRRVPTGRATL